VNRLERLINLVAALLAAERPLAREELRQRVPAYPDDDASFRRAFERDKETLRTMGIPITVEVLDPSDPTTGEGYRIPKEQYYLPDPELEPDELAALHLAATTVRLEGGEGIEAIWKLGGAPTGDRIEPVAALAGSEHLSLLFGAVAKQATVTFDYRNESRTVDPWRLAYRNGHWYLAGWDRGRDAERQFRLDRLTSTPVVGSAGAFERPPDPPRRPSKPWEMGDDDEIHAHLRVDADQAPWVVNQLGEDTVMERADDGAVVVSMRVTNRAAFRSFALDLLDRAEVVGPPDLRAEMVTWLEGVATAG
jgi:predicted DNA-binding transcriptional regulator YafY